MTKSSFFSSRVYSLEGLQHVLFLTQCHISFRCSPRFPVEEIVARNVAEFMKEKHSFGTTAFPCGWGPQPNTNLSLWWSTIHHHNCTKHRIRSIKEGGGQEVLGICSTTPTKWVIPGCSFVWRAYRMRALKGRGKGIKWKAEGRRDRGVWREQGGIGCVLKFSRYRLSVFRYPPNPGFIGCLCPATLFGLSREVGGLNTCPSLW